MSKKQKDVPERWVSYVDKLKAASVYDEKSVSLLVELFANVRPTYFGDYQKAEKSMQELLTILKEDPTVLRKLKYIIAQMFVRSEILEVFTTSGLESEIEFLNEFWTRLKHKLLPPARNSSSLLQIVDIVFYKSSDCIWIEKMNKQLWMDFFFLLDIQLSFAGDTLLSKLNRSLHIISCRIVTLSTDKEICEWLTMEEITCFIEQNRLSQNIIDFKEHAAVVEEKYKHIKQNLSQQLKACKAVVARLRSQSVTSGTSVQQTYILKQLEQLIYRMQIILDFTEKEKSMDDERTVSFFFGIVRNENNKNSILQLFRANTKVLAYRIAEHEHYTGEHYITSSRKEYKHMLISSMGGGVFAAFIAVIKSFLHKIVMAPFWQGFAYSINYSAGFLGILFTGSTLATKQPAMTASAIAKAMDDKNSDKPSMSELAILLSQVWRSQTAAFIGNLGVAFPVALLISALYFFIFKVNIVAGGHAQELLDWQNPLKSKCLLYACNTGVFLYLSGIVSGYFDNKVIHRKISQRLSNHPFLNRFFRKDWIDKLAYFVGENMGPVAGNVFLGFCLGMAGFFSYIFGIDFDIRHITISTGQFAIGLQGLGYHIGKLDLIMTIFGILSIGFLNFLVSFTLAFFTASISRGIQLKQYRHLVTYMRRLLARYPLDFIFPPKRTRMPQDLLKHR